MAIVYAENIIEIAIRATYAGRPHVNVLHVFNDETGGSDLSKVQDVRDNWQDHVLDILGDGYVLEDFAWRSLDPDDQNLGTLAVNATKPTAGAGSGAQSPPNVTYLVHKRTDNRPRGRRDGRIFLSGVPEANVDADGSVASGALTSANTALASFLSGVNDSGFTMGSGSYLAVLETTPASRAPGAVPVTIEHRPVTLLELDTRVATQRDRLR
jgi:hypothetical protein